MARMSVAGVSLGWLLLAGAAHAAEVGWDAPPGCPERDELVFRVERALGGALAAAAPLRFEARVQRARGGFTAMVDVEGKQRSLWAPDCAKLADAVAVAVALALGASDPPAASPISEPLAAPPVPPVSDSPAAAPVDLATESSAPVPRASAWLLVDAGSLPAIGAGAALGGELGWSRFQLRLLALLLFEQHVERSGQAGLGPAAGADLALLAGSVSACAAALGSFRSDAAVFMCAGPEIGRLSGSGTGVSERRSGGSLWLAPRVDVGGLWQVPGTSVDLLLSASAAAPLLRDEFVLEGAVPVHRAGNVVGRLALGVALRLE